LISLMTPVPPPNGSGGTEVLGSGKLETPCRRMHCATVSMLASACAEGGGPDPGPPPGRSFRHFACAALNAGDERSIPGPSWKPPPLGSGKLGTLLERMHLAYASNADCTSPGPDEPEPAAASPVAVLDPEPGFPLVVVKVATWGELELLHADKPNVTAAANGAVRRGRSRRRPYALQPSLSDISERLPVSGLSTVGAVSLPSASQARGPVADVDGTVTSVTRTTARRGSFGDEKTVLRRNDVHRHHCGGEHRQPDRWKVEEAASPSGRPLRVGGSPRERIPTDRTVGAEGLEPPTGPL
jgi:hypothetical protein